MKNNNIVYTKGFINDNGCIEIPGVFLEDGAEVDLAIKTKAGHFEIAMFPSEELADTKEMKDCGISDEAIMECCSSHDDCESCPLNDYCRKEFADENPYISDRP